MSPIDLFGSLLRAKFKERNSSNLPPKTIIADELLAKSKSSADLWARKKRFTQSTALMCALGFVVGLGDRHLENILLFENGEIVHVDLNVSFEKGAQLRVPERVPFRLSNSIRYAFGPTGIEGTFRSSAERTMAVLRSESLALTHLLKTFVHDPLLEWTSPASAFPIGNTSVGLSLMLYEDRPESPAGRTNGDADLPPLLGRSRAEDGRKFGCTALQSALAQICQLFSEMNAYRAAHGVQSELTHFEQRRNMMRALKPALRILSAVDQRFSVHVKIYRTLISEPLVKGHRLLNEPFIDYTRCIEYFQTALGNIESVYTQLLELRSIGDLNDGECADSAPTTPSFRTPSRWPVGSLYEAAPTASKEASSPTGVELVECVRRKLGGFQLANGELVDRPLDVVEQVDRLIAAAVDPTNLARMYEGYCSHPLMIDSTCFLMPKKFTGENSKAAAARQTKEQKKVDERERLAKQKEDAQWADDDKGAAKKMQRKEEQERKRLEALAKKQEKAKLYDEEMSTLPSKTPAAANKVTKASIEAAKRKEDEERRRQQEQKALEAKKIVQSEDLLTENVNRLVIEGESARNVDEAISILGSKETPTDKHPEKRMRAAYAAFEERRLAELKAEKSTLTLSQMKQLLRKEWQRSPENPLLGQ
ncbi:Non-specific serine/threonine protein kinase [Aphelenchoides fujianensis]|nr:Non-specific serine/threonine protein kinase [Aphelenchoides fujianensis]